MVQALLLYGYYSGIGGSPPEDSSIEGFRPQGSGTLIQDKVYLINVLSSKLSQERHCPCSHFSAINKKHWMQLWLPCT